jgi:HD-like signal output (HDOD) protein
MVSSTKNEVDRYMTPSERSLSLENESNWKPIRLSELNPHYLRIIEEVLDRFPNLPVSVQKIMTMVYDTRSSAKEISELAISDPVLATNILKQVNSSFYSFQKKIDNLNHAIILIGFNEVRNIALHCGMAKVVSGLEVGDLITTKDLWTHSYCVALGCDYWGKKLGRKDTGTLMTMGMVHDIGKFALFTIGIQAQRLGIKTRELGDIPSHASILEKEERLFRVNHAIVGSILARKWNLSERIYKVLEYHHYPYVFPFIDIPEQFREDVAILASSDYGINIIMGNCSSIIPSDECFQAVGISSGKDATPSDLKAKVELSLNFLQHATPE